MVRIAFASTDEDHPNQMNCNCGASKTHPRKKVRDEWAYRHFDKKHGGEGVLSPF